MTETLGVILAGGLARRMGGGDKALQRVGGRTVLDHVQDRVGPQVSRLVVNANGDPVRFAPMTVITDTMPDHPGPLAGVLAALDWAAARTKFEWVVTVPGDCPFLPRDLVARLHQARAALGVPFACAASGGWTHPVIALWPVACRFDLRDALLGGLRKIDAFTAQPGAATAEWATDPVDPFFNVNTPEDLAEANRLA